MTMAEAPRKRTAPLRAAATPPIAPRTAPVPPAPAAIEAAFPPAASRQDVIDDVLARATQAANRELVVGAAIFAIAALVTFVWWRMAVADAEQDGSGNHMVFYGPMLYGVYRFVRGCWYRLDPHRLLDRRSAR